MYRTLALLAGGLALSCPVSLCAQDAVLDEMYGKGVHAYFSQDYLQAYDDLSSAIDAGSSDPRCYYFRGLCYLKLGREEEAKMDFEKAAALEAEDVNRFYDVGRALERIQGHIRLIVEEYRTEARMEARKRAEEIRRQRYGERRQSEMKILEGQAKEAPPTPPTPPKQPAAPPVVKPAAKPPTPPPPTEAEKNPFEVTPAAKPPAVSPPAKQPAPAAAKPPAVSPPAKPPAPAAAKPPAAQGGNPLVPEKPKT